MKKVITMLGSLMIIAGLKAQKDPVIKKETTPAVKVSAADSITGKTKLPDKQLSSHIPKVNPADSMQKQKLPSKFNPALKPDKHNPAALPSKDAPATKPTKQ